MPKVGPWEGCRTHANTLRFMWAPRACTRPMVVVLFPSPRGVGVMLQLDNINKCNFKAIAKAFLRNSYFNCQYIIV